MIRIPAIFLFVFFFQQSVLSKESPAFFQALVVEGFVYVQTPPSTSWDPVVQGAKVKPTDVIRLSSGSYVGFIHVSGKVLELKKEGSYALQNYAQDFTTTTPYVFPILDSIILAMIEDQKSIADRSYFDSWFNPETIGKRHGGGIDEIMFMMPHEMSACDSIYLIWNCCTYHPKDKKGKRYILTFTSLYSDPVDAKYITSDTAITIPIPAISEPGIIAEVKYATLPYEQGASTIINFLSKEREKEMKEKLKILGSILQSESSLSTAIVGYYFDFFKLCGNANQHFKKATKIAPTIFFYRVLSKQYLTRHKRY